MAPLSNFMSFIEGAISSFPPFETSILARDFNIDMLQTTGRKKTMFELMQTHGMFLLPKQRTIDAGTLIDHFWSNIRSHRTFSSVLDTYWTDHYAICLAFTPKSKILNN